ncbi:bifunctional RNase H/acid phosphatase [Streptomyces minutiscleroticus]|uniref:Bifunctional RNase H/acid phosphatase n=1 Tax=Streptomyces minutiscleroticus TaxID=68238 RepID=A0A918NA20_9ACTN|nr:bifunctional RNase H/acid phosphatase [Streptomyces minutiscleroticus]GGX52606.1 bifunctional RNase H/acid phosphatase [Streptomyces minutiscleroticus]
MRELIVEADGGSRGNPGPAGYGAVVVDAETGRTLAERAEYLGTATNNVAEYRGLLAGLRAAHELDPAARVHVRMDSKLVVEQMSGRWKIKHPDLRPLASEASRVLSPSRVTYEWIPRERNKHADRLANEAMDAGARGERWSASASTAELDTVAERAREQVLDTVAEAEAEAAAAADAGTAPGAGAASGPGSSGTGSATAHRAEADVRAARNVASAGTGPTAGAGAAGAAAPATGARPAGSTASTADARAMGSTVPAADARAAGSAAPAAEVRAAVSVTSAGAPPPDLGAPATFVLLRHGETPLTPHKRFSGSGGSDPSLSDVGRHQAGRVAAALAARGTVQAVVSSPLARCRETARIVADRLGLEVRIEDGLRETDFGAWEGLTFGEVRERYPRDMDAWLASEEAGPTGGGESFAEVTRRVAAARDRLAAEYAGRTVLLVSHVTPVKTLVRLALGAPSAALFRMELSAASLSAVAYYADGNASVRLFNDTSHLR